MVHLKLTLVPEGPSNQKQQLSLPGNADFTSPISGKVQFTIDKEKTQAEARQQSRFASCSGLSISTAEITELDVRPKENP